MPDLTSQQFLPPKNWQDFELMARDLWAEIWQDPNTQRNGRAGQVQNGVDVFGRQNGVGSFHGVQCKGKDGNYGGSVSEQELKKEVEKAKSFAPELRHFILATTAPNDQAIQKVARELTEEHEQDGLFSVHVWGWDEIQAKFVEYPCFLEKYYPEQAPSIQKIKDAVERLELENKQSTNRIVREFQDLKGNLEAVTSHEVADATARNSVDQHLNSEIDGYRDQLKTNPSVALTLLASLKERAWGQLSDAVRFRLLTNIGAAHLQLSNNEEASRHFKLAMRVASDTDPKAVGNCAVAYLLDGETEKAVAFAKKAAELDPTDASPYVIIVENSQDVDADALLENVIPEEHQDNPQVAAMLGKRYLQANDYENALRWLRVAAAECSDNPRFSGFVGTLLLQIAMALHYQSGLAMAGEFEQTIEAASSLLKNAWTKSKEHGLMRELEDVGPNLLVALRMSGNDEACASLLPSVQEIAPENAQVAKVAASVHIDEGQLDKAAGVLEAAPRKEDVDCEFLYAEVLCRQKKFGDVVRLMERLQLDEDKEGKLATKYRFTLVALEKIGDTQGAQNVCDELCTVGKDKPLLLIVLAEHYYNVGKPDLASETAELACSVIGVGAPVIEKEMVADVLFSISLYSRALEIYESLPVPTRDSLALRQRLACLSRLEMRSSLMSVLRSLPDSIRSLPYYARLSIEIHRRVGNVKEALRFAEDYLSVNPDDLEIRIVWIFLCESQGDEHKVTDFLSEDYDYSGASDEDRMRYAHILARFGFPNLAVPLAYTLLRTAYSNPTICLGYIGLFLMQLIPDEILGADVVDVDTAFSLEFEDGATGQYVGGHLSGDEAILHGEISVDHPAFVAAHNKGAGEVVLVRRNVVQEQSATIKSVTNKYLHVFREVANDFPQRFPGHDGFYQVSLAKKDSEELDPRILFDMLDRKHDHGTKVIEFYNERKIPFVMMADLLGKNPLEAWVSMTNSNEIRIRCCDGNSRERQEALSVLKDGAQLVVDPMTLLSMFQMDIADLLVEGYGQLGVTQSALDAIGDIITEQQIHPATGTMSKAGDKYALEEFSDEVRQAAQEFFAQVKEWAESNCEIVPAIGDLPAAWRNGSLEFHYTAVDSALAASAENRVLLCDDLMFRALVQNDMNVNGVWSQVAVQNLVADGRCTPERYHRFCSELIEKKFDFTSINSDYLFSVYGWSEFEVTEELERALQLLGSKGTNLDGSSKVSAEFLLRVWRLFGISEEKKIQLLKCVLEQVVELDDEVRRPYLLTAYIRLCGALPDKESKVFLSAIIEWWEHRSLAIEPEHDSKYVYGQLTTFRSFLMATTFLTRIS